MDLNRYKNITADGVMDAIILMASQHGIKYVATPCDPTDYFHVSGINGAWSKPLAYSNASNFNLIPIDVELSGGSSRIATLLLYEAFETLIDAGMCKLDTPSPIGLVNGNIEIDANSPIPLSSFLLSADRTIEKLADMALENEFCEGQAFSPLWMQRTISNLLGEPEESLKPAVSMTTA